MSKKMVELVTLCDLNMGQSPDSSTYNEEGNGLPFFQGNADFGEWHPNVRVWCSEPTKIANEGDVLISVRAPIGAMNIADQCCCIGRGLAALTPKDDVCTQKYLYYAVQSRVDELIAQGTGSTFKAISKKVLEQTLIPAYSITEQNEIVSKISKVDTEIKHRKEQQDLLDLLIKSKFVEMFGGIHDSSLFPYETVGSLTTVMSGGTPDRNVKEYWDNGNIRWVKTTELQNCVITDTEEQITQEGLDNSSAKIIPAGSVLIAMYGQGKTRGMTAYLAVECTTNQACACILPSQKTNQVYLWQYMILSYDKLRDMAKGGNQPNLNAGIIKSFPVLVPPIELQNQFVDFVNVVDKSKEAIQKSINELEILKKSLMQKYFG